ncbi:MAG: heme lyase CcmF/NrfE family subunit [Nitrospirae bacterium]|nr:heme lyase CcmF/NrfE family subunit [Magnetococcales bacterium]HAT49386.1 c-type cytochrome biogenesis protein CcmF [Alphaproteobacteria bacterium]
MWIELAHFATIIALLLALLQIATPIIGVGIQRPVWIRVARQSSYVVTLLLTLASAGLVVSFLNHDFSVKYVAEHASRSLPTFYLVTALWGGHEGSLLFWAWLLSLFTTIAVWRHWSTHASSIPWILSVLGTVISGFLILVLFLSSPFERLTNPPFDGRDLNPLLQDPGMVFHPPFLYIGYVGFAIPFAFAIAALINGRITDEWILATRRWTLFSWAMLTTGIIFGAYWAYYELGWGGYWAWDPVENASFMPWLVATAFFHSVMVQERRRMFKIWNLFLIITTFALSLLGTFLVRSGVLSSVHAFASDPGRGVYILIFMAIILLFSFGLLVLRADRLRTEVQLESLFSLEAAFLFNNLFFIIAGLTVLLGTLYPLAVETLSSAKVTVGAPYYNKVFVPIMLGVLILMGLGPLLTWRGINGSRLRSSLVKPLGISVLGMAGCYLLGVGQPYAILMVGLSLFAIAAHLTDLGRGITRRMTNAKEGILTATVTLLTRNKRRYGGFVVHFGILMMAAGFVGSGLFQEEKNLIMAPGDFTAIDHWRLTFEKIVTVKGSNWEAQEAIIRVEGPRGLTMTLHPQKRDYQNQQMPTTEAAIFSGFFEDLYVVLGDAVTDNTWAFRIYRNPLVSWIWGGSGVMALGVFFSLLQGRRREVSRQ